MAKKLNLDFTANGNDPHPGPIAHVSAMVFDLDRAKDQFSEYEKKLDELATECESLVVDDERSAAIATEIIGSCRKLFDDIETTRKRIFGKADQYVRSGNSFCKIFKDRLNAIALTKSSTLKRKLADHAYKIELERRKEEKRIRDEVARKQIKINEDAEDAGVAAPTLPDMKLPKKMDPVRTEKGSSSARMVWEFEIIDPQKIPRQFCVPSDQLIKAAVKAGIRKIDGVRIFETASITHRRA